MPDAMLPPQVASGLSYLHEHNIVYYDLKSPNVLAFQFPTPQESLYATQTLGYDQHPVGEGPVYVKIADLGISRRLSPGGVKGFKGSPGFMAPEILKYVGTEACTEKVSEPLAYRAGPSLVLWRKLGEERREK